MKGKDCFHVCQKIKNRKINCKVHKLMIVTKKIINFNVISFTARTMCSLLEFQKPFATNQDLSILYIDITVQFEDLNQLRFSCLLEFTSFSSSSLLLLLSSGNSIDFN